MFEIRYSMSEKNSFIQKQGPVPPHPHPSMQLQPIYDLALIMIFLLIFSTKDLCIQIW